MVPKVLRRLARRLLRRTGYAVVWRNPRGYSLPSHLIVLFERLGVDCVLDVGAHFGEYGSLLRHYGYRGRIVSFEPVAASFERLTDARAGDADWRAYNVALGSEDGEHDLNVARDTALSSFHEPSSRPLTAALVVESRERVQVRTLDSVFEECVAGLRDPRVFLKMDTQGWDREVLRGAERTLPRVDGLQSEVSVLPLYEGMTDYLEAIRELQDLGFDLTGIYPVAYDGFRVVELDVVLARAAG
jgi:FkbM family methyltransferase